MLVLLLIQLIPVDKTNPPVVSEPAWDSPQTRALAKDACFDCHSNETVWPWYAKIAPVSWLVKTDVNAGRSALNFSEWGQGEMEAGDLAETINEGGMPPAYYTLMHPNAKLSDSEKQALIIGLQASVGQSSGQANVNNNGESNETENDD